MRPEPQVAAHEIWRERFPGARVVFLAGPVVRGEATPYSGLDFVVIYDRVEAAWRESFIHRGWPVEAFVHDPESLEYFFHEIDRKSGVPSLLSKVAEGIPIPGRSGFSDRILERAQALLRSGPPVWSTDELSQARYVITHLCDDLRAPRNSGELLGVGARLYEALADFSFRSEGKWSAHGKMTRWRMQQKNPMLHARFHSAFELLFAKKDAQEVLALASELLSKQGGFIFEGLRIDAPATWKKFLTVSMPLEAPVLRTSRLILRMAQESDVPAILQFFRDNAERLKPMDPPWPIGFMTEPYWKEKIPAFDQEWQSGQALRLLVFVADGSPLLVGRIGFTQMCRGPFQACSLGYAVAERFEGQGLMREALEAAIQFVFNELSFHRIMANHLPENFRSAGLLNRLGFKTEGLAPDYLHVGGQWRDHVLTALTHSNWRPA